MIVKGLTVRRMENRRLRDHPEEYDLPAVFFSAGILIILYLSTNRSIVSVIGAAVIAACFAYFVIKVRSERREREELLERVQYMLEMGEILTEAYRKPEQITEALKRAAHEVNAQRSFLLVLEETVNQAYLWEKSGQTDLSPLLGKRLEDMFYGLKEAAIEKQPLLYYDMEYFKEQSPEGYRLLEELKIHNLMLIPILNQDGRMDGILGADGLGRRWENTDRLQCVASSFSMMLRNMQSYQRLRDIGLMDVLTGLKNRNSFEQMMRSWEKEKVHSLACIYMDVNGLHDLNNSLGHDAGDEMLRQVARKLTEEFGLDYAYRIGGDEYVVFVPDADQSSVRHKVRRLETAVEEAGYHISAGIEWREGEIWPGEIVKEAERKMAEKKKQFYEEGSHRHKMRDANRKLEQILSDKRDAEAFLSVLAPEFYGVYVVNLCDDLTHCIYVPDYYERMLEASGGRHSRALELYAKEYVLPQFQEQFARILDYEWLKRRLEKEGTVKLSYQRKDGRRLLLRVCRPKKELERSCETIWLFEDASGEPGS